MTPLSIFVSFWLQRHSRSLCSQLLQVTEVVLIDWDEFCCTNSTEMNSDV